MKSFKQFVSDTAFFTEDVDSATITRMSDEQFQELLKRSSGARRNELMAMRQSAPSRNVTPSRVTVNNTPAPSVSPTSTTRPSLLKRAANQFDPSKAITRRGAFGRGVNRQLGLLGADIAADQAINQIPDQGTREKVRAVKDTAATGAFLYANPAMATALNLSGSSRRDATMPYADTGYTFSKLHPGREQDTPEDGTADEYTDRFLRTGGTDAKPTYNDPRQKITAIHRGQFEKDLKDPRFTREYIPNPKSNPLNPFNQYMIKNPNYKPGSNEKLFKDTGSKIQIGAARQGGQIIPVEWGSVAGIKKVGTPQDVAAVQARQRAGQQGAYGSRQGVAVVGTGGRTTVNRQDNTITSGGRTAKLPSTKILAGGRVGDLAYKDGKPVYLARADMAQRGNQNLLARLSRATGIGGQREKDAAALKREREQALKNTIQYRREIGAGGGSISAK